MLAFAFVGIIVVVIAISVLASAGETHLHATHESASSFNVSPFDDDCGGDFFDFGDGE